MLCAVEEKDTVLLFLSLHEAKLWNQWRPQTQLPLYFVLLTGWRCNRHKYSESGCWNFFCHPCGQNTSVSCQLLQQTSQQWAESYVFVTASRNSVHDNIYSVIKSYICLFPLRKFTTKKEIHRCPDGTTHTIVSKGKFIFPKLSCILNEASTSALNLPVFFKWPADSDYKSADSCKMLK